MLSLRNNKPLSNCNLSEFYITHYEPSHALSVEFQTNFTVRMKREKIRRLREMQSTPLIVRIIRFFAEVYAKQAAAEERRKMAAAGTVPVREPIRPIALVRETTKSPRTMLKTLTQINSDELNCNEKNRHESNCIEREF